MNIVIIEDEKPAADDLQQCLQSYHTPVRIEAVLSSVAEALSYFSKGHSADLIFSDIQLGDGMSFDIFEKRPPSVPVIFCTAFDDYALQAFRTNGIDYILKPFSCETIHKAIQKYESLRQAQAPDLSLLLAAMQKKKPTGIIVHYRDKIIPLRPSDIALLHMKDENGTVLCFDQKAYPLSQPLDQLEQNLGEEFFRVNRQVLVHRKAVQSATRYFGRKLAIDLSLPYPETVLVSKEKTQAFLNWLLVV